MLPVLGTTVTARLQLRFLTMNEARELLAVVAASRPELGRFMSWPRELHELEHARRFVRFGRDGWLAGRTVRMGMFERASGILVGSVELDGIDLRRSQAELGYWVRTDRSSVGYATEGGRVLVRYGFETLKLHKIRADVAVGNDASARVLEKLGFHREGMLREDRPVGGVFTDHWRYGLLAREFEPAALATAPNRDRFPR